MPSYSGIHCPIRRQARARPGALALWSSDRRWTYAELNGAVAATRGRLQEANIGAGQRVSLCLSRSPEFVILLWALWRQGAIAVPISTRLPAAGVRSAARKGGASVLIAGGETVSEVQEDDLEVRRLRTLVSISGESDTGSPKTPSSSFSFEQPATIVYTSGSTGAPKGVLHTWGNHLYSAKGANANIPLRAGDRWILSLPLYHVGGLAVLFRCALAGAAVAIPDLDAVLSAAIDRAGGTHVSLVSTQLRRLLDNTKGAPPGQLRALLLGGGPIPEALLRRGYKRGWPLHTSYGCTEMASQITTTPPGAPLDELLTAGRLLPHRRLRIDEDGQILVAGAPLCQGYVDGQKIRDPRKEGGWYTTRDLGRLDARGFLHVRGRMDHMFVSGGENIQPQEIEAALEALKEIERAIVVPVPDAEYGHRPVAFVQVRGKREVEVWKTSLEETLPRFKVPDSFFPFPESMNNEGMKIDREALQQRARLLHTN